MIMFACLIIILRKLFRDHLLEESKDITKYEGVLAGRSIEYKRSRSPKQNTVCKVVPFLKLLPLKM